MTDGRSKRRRRWLAAFILLVALIVVVPVAGIEGFCRRAAPVVAPSAAAAFPASYVRASAEDFARFLDDKSESGFTYSAHILGFWQTFCALNRGAPDAGPPTGAKVAIYAVGMRYSAEHAAKGAYENTIGRFTEWWRGPDPTPEDIYARAVAQDYADFLQTGRTAEFPFTEKLRGLWTATPLRGPSAVRRFERKFALSTEYGIKAGVGWLIRTAR